MAEFDVKQSRLVDGKTFESPGLYRPEENAPPVQAKPPTAEQLYDLLDSDPDGMAKVAQILESYGVTVPFDVARARAAEYVARFIEHPPGSERFAEELARATNGMGQFNAVNTARRVAQQYSTLEASDGDRRVEFIWVTEGDEATCDECAANGGVIQSLAQWEAEGLPGASVCLGGDRCRCDLIRID